MTTDRPTPAAFAGAAWSDVLPRYEALAARPLASGTVEVWLADWSALEEALDEAGNLAWIAFTTDTADPVKEGHWIRFAGEIAPRHDEQNVRLADRTFDLGYSRPDLVRRDDWSGIGDNRQVGRSHQLIAQRSNHAEFSVQLLRRQVDIRNANSGSTLDEVVPRYPEQLRCLAIRNCPAPIEFKDDHLPRHAFNRFPLTAEDCC